MTTTEGTRGALRPTNHPGEPLLSPSHYFACDFPERPFEMLRTAGGLGCYACWVYLVSAVKLGHGDSPRTRLEPPIGGLYSLRESVLVAGHRHGHFDRSGIAPESL